MNRHYFTIEVGDYFEDGHGQYIAYPASADKPLQYVCAAHRKIVSRTGINLYDFANGHKDDILPDAVRNKLLNLGYRFKTELYHDDIGYHFLDSDTLADAPEELARIWVFLLNTVDPDLHCSLESRVSLSEMIGAGSVGYGLF